MKNGKSSDNDGLTKDFYTAFFGELRSLLLKTSNYSFVTSELSSSQKQAAITLIQIKDRDVQSVSWSLAEFRHNKIVQSPHENYFNVCRQHKEK